MTQVLLVLTGAALYDEVARCGAAAGYRIVRGDPTCCRPDWLRAGAVVVDGAALAALGRPPSRSGVLVVSGIAEDPGAWRRGLAVGARGGFVLPADETALVAALSEVRRPRRNAAAVVAVAGGHGGVGASTFAALLGLASAREHRGVLLLDVEPAGAGLDLLLGAEEAPGLRWSAITGETGSIAGQALSDALPRVGTGLRVLTRGRNDGEPLSAETVLAVLDAARTYGQLVIADVGRATDPAAAGVLDSADLTAVLTAASVPGVAATRKLVARVGQRSGMGLVVRLPAPGGLSAEQVSAAIGLPLTATLRTRPGLARRCDENGLRWVPRSPEGRAVREVLAALTPEAALP